jgi:hypothetical protein
MMRNRGDRGDHGAATAAAEQQPGVYIVDIDASSGTLKLSNGTAPEEANVLRRFGRVVAVLASDFSRDVVGFALNNPLNGEGQKSWLKKSMVIERRYAGNWSTLLNPFDGWSEFRGNQSTSFKAVHMFIGVPFDFRKDKKTKTPQIGPVYYPYFAVRVVAGALIVGFRWTIGAGIQALSRQRGFGWLARPIQGARYLATFFDGAIQAIVGVLAHAVLILPAMPFVWAAVKIDQKITERTNMKRLRTMPAMSFENPAYQNDGAEQDKGNDNAPPALYEVPVPAAYATFKGEGDLYDEPQGKNEKGGDSTFTIPQPEGNGGFGADTSNNVVSFAGDDAQNEADEGADAQASGNPVSSWSAQPGAAARAGLFGADARVPVNPHDPYRQPYDPLNPYDSIDRHQPRKPMGGGGNNGGGW